MKKLIYLLFSVFLLIPLVACGGSLKTIQITPYEDILYCGESAQLYASVMFSDDDITDKTNVIWSTSDSDIVTVSNSGIITGVSSGTASITVTTEKDSTIKDTIEVTVGVHVSDIVLDNSALELLTDGDAAIGKINYDIIPENAYCKDVVFLSSNESVVSVDADGTVHAAAPGTATISVVSADKACEKEAICEVSVKQAVTEISLNENSVDFYMGDELTLIAQVAPDNADNKQVTWYSSNEDIATVSQEGTITAISYGKVEIRCSAQDGSNTSASCFVTIVNPVQKLEFSETNLTLLIGSSAALSTKQLTYSVLPEDATYKDVVWSSSDESIAIVDDNGNVTGVAPGTAKIVATTTDPRFAEKISVACNVTVGNAVTGITFQDTESNIIKGRSIQLRAIITPEKVFNSKLTWKSSDENILTVDARGNVRALKTGTAKIICSATDGSGTSYERSFTVYQPVTSLTPKETGRIVLFEGKSTTLHANVSPADASNKKLEWSSDNTYVATVDSSGYVTAKHAGNAVITAKATDGSNRTCMFRICVEPVVPLTVDSIGFGVYNANLLGLTVKNNCSTKSIRNFDFDIELISYYGSELDASGSYSIGSDVYIGAGATQTIKRTLSGVSWTQKIKITITGVEFTDGTFYSIPYSEQETWIFSR